MLIQFQDLKQQLKQKLLPIYVLAGPDLYSVDRANQLIRDAFRLAHPHHERKLFQILSDSDWYQAQTELQSGQLFSEDFILDLRFDKKSIDSTGKKILQQYTENINADCLLILNCPQVPLKNLQGLSASSQVVLVSAPVPSTQMMQKYLFSELSKNNYQFDSSLIEFILSLTNRNMFACSQFIKVLTIIYPEGSNITETEVRLFLSNQSEYELYDLSSLCLAGQAKQAIQVLSRLLLEKDNVFLCLWLIVKEIHVLMQFKQLLRQGYSFQQSCKQLNIWQKHINFYQKANERLSESNLEFLLMRSQEADETLKSNSANNIKHLLMNIVLAFCKETTHAF